MTTKNKCQDCGNKDHNGNLHLHVEIENLKQRLLEKEHHILNMETNFLKDVDKYPNGEYAALREELLTWQDKYSRLHEAYKRVQKVNQNLEDKLLKMVDKCETEKSVLNSEISALTRKLVDDQYNINKLNDENERYRNDLNMAIQALQCKPSNYITQKCDSLPSEYQAKVRSYMSSKQRRIDGNGNVNSTQKPKHEVKTIKVPIPTFPPTAMVYSLNKTVEKDADDTDSSQSQEDLVSAAIMAKILEERERERLNSHRHCPSCRCHGNEKAYHSGGLVDQVHKTTQTSSGRDSSPVSRSSSVSSREGLLISLHSDDNTPASTPRSGKKSHQISQSNTNPSQPSHTVNKSARSHSNGTSVSNHSIGNHSNTNVNIGNLSNQIVHTSVPSNQIINTSVPSNEVPDLINLAEDTTSSTGSDVSGPRLVSVRIPAGSNNILLDNAAAFAGPILYKSRSTVPSVHSSPPMRSTAVRLTDVKSDASISSDEDGGSSDAGYSSLARVRTETRI
ncbi:hypothetical protein M8J76_007095 [Diaphorina citri]|nr:hypothetical protein M8J76_007095 [Diaphorina citri]